MKFLSLTIWWFRYMIEVLNRFTSGLWSHVPSTNEKWNSWGKAWLCLRTVGVKSITQGFGQLAREIHSGYFKQSHWVGAGRTASRKIGTRPLWEGHPWFCFLHHSPGELNSCERVWLAWSHLSTVGPGGRGRCGTWKAGPNGMTGTGGEGVIRRKSRVLAPKHVGRVARQQSTPGGKREGGG